MTQSLLTDTEWRTHRQLIQQLNRPIVVLGAGGFIGSIALHLLMTLGANCIGVVRDSRTWRGRGLGLSQLTELDLKDHVSVQRFLNHVQPGYVLNFSAVGGYPTQLDVKDMLDINVGLVGLLAKWSSENDCVIVHSGSSSEYGLNCEAPSEDAICLPNSAYSITKLAGTNFLNHFGLTAGTCSAVLRFYSVYGPFEEPTRLLPTLIRDGFDGRLPLFSSPNVSRDFVFVTDAIEAVWRAAIHVLDKPGAHIYNIGSGIATTMVEVADTAKKVFEIKEDPVFSTNLRQWDLEKWYSDSSRAQSDLGWKASISFNEGLRRTRDWYSQTENKTYLEPKNLNSTPKQRSHKISAIIACYKDELAIPIMHSRLVSTFKELQCEYEIIFVNDASPDNTASVLQAVLESDKNVAVITHTRNFGSQAAFLSGLEISSGDACVLLDGDLQDPPEVIAEFYNKWIEGFDVVYGVRETREAPAAMRFSYKLFYRLLNRLSPFQIPKDAGDFSLMSRSIVEEILKFPEREMFLRTSRAFVGGRQTGVSYHRPERMFGKSTNSPLKNVQWAIQGILSVSRKPLTILGLAGIGLASASVIGLLIQLLIRIVSPISAPPGLVSVILLVGLFGSLNLLAISVIGEYIGRVLDEVRHRPRFIRSKIERSSTK